MVTTDTEIVHESKVADLESFSTHKNIRNFRRTWRGFLMYEFYDEVFEISNNPDLKIRMMIREDPRIHARLKEIVEEHKALLAPIFKGETTQNFKTGYGFEISGIRYSIPMLKRDPIVKLDPLPSKRENPNLRSTYSSIRAVFKKEAPKFGEAFQGLIADWKSWAFKSEHLIAGGDIRFKGMEAEVDLHFGPNFQDSLAVLIAAINHTKKSTSIDFLYL